MYRRERERGESRKREQKEEGRDKESRREDREQDREIKGREKTYKKRTHVLFFLVESLTRFSTC
jgi:hypothetical protein